MSRALILLAMLAAGLLQAPVDAFAQARFGKTRPLRINAYGPWQVVIWGTGNRIDYCTLIRFAGLATTPNYGIRVDKSGATFSIQTTVWNLTPKTQVNLLVTPADGAERELAAMAVSRKRADVEFDLKGPFLDQLRAAKYLDVRLDGVSVRLPFDDFDGARVALDMCARIIGRELMPVPATGG